MSSESDTEFKNENNSPKPQPIRTEVDVVHYRLRGAEREKALPPREDSPKEENQQIEKKKKSLFKRMIDSFSSLLHSENPGHSASSPANSVPETASQNSISGENLESVNAQIEVKDEVGAQTSGTDELSTDVCGLK